MYLLVNKHFKKHFLNESFIVTCSVCDRLKFHSYVSSVKGRSARLLSVVFPAKSVHTFAVRAACKTSLNVGKFLHLY